MMKITVLSETRTIFLKKIFLTILLKKGETAKKLFGSFQETSKPQVPQEGRDLLQNTQGLGSNLAQMGEVKNFQHRFFMQRSIQRRKERDDGESDPHSPLHL